MAKSDSSGKFHRRQLRSGVDKEPWQYSMLSRTLRINRKPNAKKRKIRKPQ